MNLADEMVETATRANYDAMTYSGAWDELDWDQQESGRERVYMRAALEAVGAVVAGAALEAVLALHSPHSSYPTYCRADGEERPCPTVTAIESALRGES